MAEPERKSEGLSLFWEALADYEARGGRTVFWACPAGCRGQVVWDFEKTPSLATCQVCGKTNQDPK